MASVLNLNNEVVKMRKDVKKVKVLTIRKLTRNISKLKSKKGTEELIQKNQRRAQRLLEEIHTIKKLRPDDVTKSALQKEINFEKVCKKPNSTVETRAVARLATHPLLKKKISAIKDAIKEFKEARKLAAEQETETEETHKPAEAVKIVRTEAGDSKSENESMDDSPCTTILKETTLVSSNLGNEDSVLSSQDAEKPELFTVPKLSPERRLANDVSEKPATLTVPKLSSERRPANDVSEKPATLTVPKLSSERKTTDDAPEKPASPLVPKISSERKPVEGAPEKTEILAAPKVLAKRKTAALAPKKTASLTVPKISLERKPVEKVPQNQALQDKTEKKTHELKPGSDSSDIEDSDKEDKEYFDDSTEERFCKQSSGFEDSDSDSDDDFFIGKVRHTKKKKSSKFPPKDKPEKEKLPVETIKPSPGVMESQKGNPAPKTVKLESVFFSSLSSDMKKRSFMKRENKFPPVRNKTAVLPQVPKFMKKPQFGRSSAVKIQSRPEPALHPSWEASKKRKEQSQIAVFQGKKIVFDD